MNTTTNVPTTTLGSGSAARRVPWGHRRWFVALRSFAVFIAVWYVAFLWNGNPIQLPSPFRVAAALWQLAASGELFEHAAISTSRLVIALAVVTLVAVPLGFVMGLYRAADRFIDPVVELLRPSDSETYCPYKGNAGYYHVVTAAGATVEDAVWTYEKPYPAVERIAGHVAFYPDKADIVVA